MSGYKVDICGINTSALPLLSEEETNAMLTQIKAGDLSLRETFINANLRLVLSVTRRFYNSNENADDIFQIGCVGLIKAIDNFDITQNVKFSTYAVPMIMGEIRRYLRDNNSLRVSRSLKDIAYKALSAKEALMKTNYKEPTIMEIANEIGIDANSINMALDAIQTPVSINEPLYTDNGDSLYICDQISDKQNVEEEVIHSIAVNNAINRLDEKEKQIIILRYFKDKTQMEVSKEIGISQAQVSRLEKNALKSLRFYLKD